MDCLRQPRDGGTFSNMTQQPPNRLGVEYMVTEGDPE